MLSLTPRAAQKVKDLAKQQNKPAGFLRLRVKSGGCAGLSYEFEISDLTAQGDQFFESDGGKLVIDSRSLLFVDGSVVDYAQSLMKSGFEVTNPKATSSCACGTSFDTDAPFSV